MATADHVMLIPSMLSSAESNALARSLKKKRCVILGKSRLGVVAKMNDRLFGAIAKSPVGVRDIWMGALGRKRLKNLPEELKRPAIFWNLYLKQGSGGVPAGAALRSLKEARLALRKNRVYDLKRKTFVGPKIARKEGKVTISRWGLSQGWTWYAIPVVGPFGIPLGHEAVIKLSSYANVVCSSLSAAIGGPHINISHTARNARVITVNGACYIPIWEVTNKVRLTSNGTYNGQSRSRTTTLTV
jgi:hypothetical protein